MRHFLFLPINHVVLASWPLEALQIGEAEDCSPAAAFPILISPRLLTSFPAGLATGHFSLLFFHSSGFLSLCFPLARSLWMFVSLCASHAVSIFLTFTHCCF